MNESSQGGISKSVQTFVLWISILGLICIIGGYTYYIYVVKHSDSNAYLELERIRADEEFNRLVESMPKANPDDELSEGDVRFILQQNTKASPNDTLTIEESNQIIRNNTEAR